MIKKIITVLKVKNVFPILIFCFALLLTFKIIHINNVSEVHIIILYVFAFLELNEEPHLNEKSYQGNIECKNY